MGAACGRCKLNPGCAREISNKATQEKVYRLKAKLIYCYVVYNRNIVYFALYDFHR